jgi:adenosylhomocysteine nucleosidase
MDARPLINQFEIPLLNLSYFEMHEDRKKSVFNKINDAVNTGVFFEEIDLNILQEFAIDKINIHLGSIASGDQFFSTNQQKNKLSNLLPDVLCVEMEGSAVAQVCYENEIPFTIIRTISDAADDGSPLDFPRFVQQVTKAYTTAMVKALL